MGRTKLKMALIEQEKSRNLTFKKRKEGLIRQLHELTTLCDVQACMIIHGGNTTAPEIWQPGKPDDEVGPMIELYRKAKNMYEDSGCKTFGLSDFFDERKKKIDGELKKLRKKNVEAKYPTWIQLLSFLNEAQLRDFAAALDNKAQSVRNRIEFLMRNYNKQILLLDNNTSYNFAAAGAMIQLHQEINIIPPLNPFHYVQQAQQYYVPAAEVVVPLQYAVVSPQLRLLAVENYGSDYQVGWFSPLMEFDENEIGGLEGIVKNYM